jgi:pilus assembly protein Flp/PilA
MLDRIYLRLRRLVQDETGPTAVEYAVLMSLIVIVCVGAVKQLSNATAETFDVSAAAIDSAMNGN